MLAAFVSSASMLRATQRPKKAGILQHVKRMKTLLLLSVLWTGLCATVGSSLAANLIRVSDYGDGTCSRANAQLAYNAAAAGDTIIFPGGSCTWTQGLTISKPLTLDGNGTILSTTNIMATGMFYITGMTSSVPMRVTGFTFYFTTNWTTEGNGVNIYSSVSLGNLRVDHNIFNYGYQAMQVAGSKGVIDHNYFYNTCKAISFTAGAAWQADASWASMAAGTGDALFIEDNHFIDNASYPATYGQEKIGTFNGGKLVVRYNEFDFDHIPILNNCETVQTHGSAPGGVAGGYWQIGTGARRGQSVVEIYNNNQHGYRIAFMCTLRGGANLVHHNTNTDTWGPAARIYLREEESTSSWTPSRTNWPSEDQVHNTFIWSNTFNGVIQATPDIAIGDLATDIQQDRDYFLHAPEATGGKETFTGANGASSSFPTDGITYPTKGTMVFTPVGPNAYYGYQPYTYPHPLTSTNFVSTPPVKPLAPLNLRDVTTNLPAGQVQTNLWISQTQNDSYYDTSYGILAQSIDGSAPKVINCIELLFQNFTNPQTVTVDIRTAQNGGGSSLGSCTRAVTTGGTSEWVRFAMPNVSITNTVYLTLTTTGTIRWRNGLAGGALYGGTTYCLYGGPNAARLQDFCMKVYTP